MQRRRVWIGLVAGAAAMVLAAGAVVQTRHATATGSCEQGTAGSDTAYNTGLVADCTVLLAARNTLAGRGTLDWSTSTPVTSWEGVGVSGTPSRVTSLDLRLKSLTGTIPAELGSLAQLEELYLGDNQLTGSIPVELGQLGNLTALYLDNNQLTGSIPVELGQLTNLTHLRLYINQLTGSIPVELGQLTNLTQLNLYFNQLTGSIPVELGQLTNLTELRLSANELTGSIPVELGQLRDLQILALSTNELTGSIPMELGQLSDLTALDLEANQLTGSIPVELGQLSDLAKLSVRGNQLTGSIPMELGQLADLTGLYLTGNQLTGSIPVELGQLANLTSLWVGDNQLTGSIPVELGRLSSLESLHLDDNQLTGSIPLELGQVANLTSLWVSGNELTGSIPVELGQLANLTGLILSDNQLTGGIPVELGQLAHLTTLWVRGNQLTGCLPAELRSVENSNGLLGLPDCGVVAIATDAMHVREGTAVTFTITRAGGTLTEPLTVQVSVSESGATIDGTPAEAVMILADESSAVLTVPTVDDAVGEHHSVIMAEIERASGSYVRASASSAHVTVTDDDGTLVTISAVTTPIGEGESAVFRVVATGGEITQPLAVPVTVTESRAMIDPASVLPTSVTISALGAPVEFSVGTQDDTAAESDSVITATLTSGAVYNAGPPASAHVTVRDDDPVVSFTAPEEVTEGETAVFTFTREGGVSHELQVSVSVLLTGAFLSGTAPTSVTFDEGVASTELEIHTDDDSVLEANGNIAVLLKPEAYYNTSGTLLQRTVVEDNDSPVVTISAVNTPIDEGASAVFSVEATSGVITEAIDVLIAVTESGAIIDTASALPVSVTISAIGSAVEFPVPTADDTTAERDSVITAMLTSGTLYELDAVASADVTVRDDDPVVSFTAPDRFPEGETAVFTFEREGGVSHELSVNVSVLPTGDFLAGTTPTSVMFTAGASSASLEIGTLDDSVPEADGHIAVLLKPGVDYNTAGMLLQQAVVEDNDRSTVSITAVASPVKEGSAAVFRLTRTGGTIKVPVTVSVTETGEMIDGVAPTSVTIEANQTSADLRIATTEDAIDEVDSVITVALVNGETYDLGAASSAEVTVNDDDRPTVTITLDGMSPLVEGTTASFTVERMGATTGALTIDVSVIETGNMISGTAPTTLTFNPNELTASLRIETDDDSMDEPDSTIFVGVTLQTSARRSPPDLVSVTVTDND